MSPSANEKPRSPQEAYEVMKEFVSAKESAQVFLGFSFAWPELFSAKGAFFSIEERQMQD